MFRHARNSITPIISLVILAVVAGWNANAHAKSGPPATRVQVVVDTLHGVPVSDPYRWLEDGANPEVRQWTEAQSEYFHQYADSFSGRELIRKELMDMLAVAGVGEVFNRGDLYFSMKRQGGQNQPVMYVRHGLTGKPEVLIDPNSFSSDGTRAMDWYSVSDDGSLIAYGVSSSGTENSTLYLMRTADRSILADSIPNTRAAAVAFLPDNRSFYYTRYPETGSVPVGDEQYYRRIYYHTIGTGWKSDPLFWEDKGDKTSWCGVSTSPDGHWLFVSNSKGWTSADLYLKDLSKPDAPLQTVVAGRDFLYDVIPLNDRFLIRTNEGAGRFRILAGRYDTPQPENWSVLVPESDGTLDAFLMIGKHLITHSLQKACSQIRLFGLDGGSAKEIKLPELGTAASFGGEWKGHELFFYFSSHTRPPSILRYDLDRDSLTEFDRMKLDVNFSNLETKQVWYTSKDGTPISMFIVAPKGTKLDGTNPVLLDGYGGFDVSVTPEFSRKIAIWLMHGGIYAQPNLRGGGEYGENWHRDGMLEKKQNVFDDFIAAAEYLIKEKYTSPEHLAIYGGSNGGLLIGAVVTQRPELYAAAVCDVPLLDMIRYDRFQIAKIWVPEYGTSDDSAQFQYLLKYSPYQHVENGVKYPAILFKAGESDSRVDPMHARKMTALMQARTGSDRPILLRIDTKSGHGQGKPTAKVADEIVDEYSFLFRALSMRL
jgi:prolyl oligopeptidase